MVDNGINIIYTFHSNYIKLFGYEFVGNNKKNCKIIYENKMYSLIDEFKVGNIGNIEIKLLGINNITNLKYMFYGCKSLVSINNMSNWNTSHVTNMSHMFEGCSSLSTLPDISKWNTSNVTHMIAMFSGCKKSLKIPSKFK